MKNIPRALCALLTISLSICMTVSTFGARTVTDVQKEQAESQKNLDQAESEASNIEENREETEAEMAESQEKLAQIITSVSIIEDEIKDKTKAVEEAKEQYDIAKKKEEEQYASMKRRIKYMYEHGGSISPYAELFSGGSDFADMLNRSAYVEEIYEYDRGLLEEYQKTKEQVKESEERLQNELDELKEIKDTYEEESDELQKTINDQKAKVENFNEQLASARAKASQYKNQIAAQNKEIKRIVEAEEAAAAARKKKAEEEAAKKKKAEEAARKKAEEEGRSSKKEENEDEYAPEEGDYEKESSSGGSSSGGGNGTGSQIASYAQQFLGNPYVSGGTSLTDGCDCSGFTQSVFSHFGYSIPRTSWEQQTAGRGVSYSDAQPGDLFCYSGHVGIYIGNNTICHASTPETGIKLTPATYRDIVTIRRIV